MSKAAILVCGFAAALTASACTSVDACDRGAVGCACDDGRCDSGATCNTEGLCIARGGGSGSGGSGGGGSSGSGSPMVELNCTDKSFDDACAALCDAVCQLQDDLCVASKCDNGGCRDLCVDICDGDAGCVARACEALAEPVCKTFGAESNDGVFYSFCVEDDPLCVPDSRFECSNVCGSLDAMTGGDLAGNGQCQDGGEGSLTVRRCARGTDCDDCGKRTCAEPLAKCSNNGECCGFPEEAFCVGELGVCLPTCDDDKPCEPDAICTPLADGMFSVCVPS